MEKENAKMLGRGSGSGTNPTSVTHQRVSSRKSSKTPFQEDITDC